MLSLDHLQVGYRLSGRRSGEPIYIPITISLDSPEMIGLIGRNGIGKSTLLRTLAGLQEPLAGSIKFFGKESSRISRTEMAGLVSYVSTEVILVQHLRVYELVSLGRFPHVSRFGRMNSDDESIVHDAMEQTGILPLGKKPLHQLSDGERQRVMIARALAQDTPIIILDEPTAFLDLPARHEIMRLLATLSQEKNKLILFSTHDLAIAMDEVDKLWLMADQGLLEGAPEDLLINGGFRKLFTDSDLSYDPATMSFRFKRIPRGSIAIEADPEYYLYTSKAMERIGYNTVSKDRAENQIQVVLDNGRPSWLVPDKKGTSVFKSLYDLIDFFKKIPNNY